MNVVTVEVEVANCTTSPVFDTTAQVTLTAGKTGSGFAAITVHTSDSPSADLRADNPADGVATEADMVGDGRGVIDDDTLIAGDDVRDGKVDTDNPGRLEMLDDDAARPDGVTVTVAMCVCTAERELVADAERLLKVTTSSGEAEGIVLDDEGEYDADSVELTDTETVTLAVDEKGEDADGDSMTDTDGVPKSMLGKGVTDVATLMTTGVEILDDVDVAVGDPVGDDSNEILAEADGDDSAGALVVMDCDAIADIVAAKLALKLVLAAVVGAVTELVICAVILVEAV